MGAVWLAHDTTLGREVAVKRLGLVPGGDAAGLARAAREARLAARLNHPHVVHVFDLVNEDEGQWLVMEYVEGQTLAAMIRTEGAMSPDRAAALVGQAADALAAAHAAGIVHRDVKPSNMLVGGTDEVKLSDFGIARAEADPSLTQTGLVTGSPAYLSPEVASGHMATTASDVWSLGATLYHALSGQPPYEVGENLMGALYRIVHEEPPRLADAGWLAPLLEATMTKEPDDRWSMAQVRDFLHSHGRVAGPAGGETTQVMTAPVPLAPGPIPDPTPTPTATPAATPIPTPTPAEPAAAPVTAAPRSAAGPGCRGRSRRCWSWCWVRWPGCCSTRTTAPRRPSTARTRATARAAGVAGTARSPPTASRPRRRPSSPPQRGWRGFISDYLATAPSSPETTFAMLTPGFQDASGGIDGYSGYWSTIAEATPVEINADPEALTVEYTVDYTRQDGSQVTDTVVLQLQYADGQYLIADEA